MVKDAIVKKSSVTKPPVHQLTILTIATTFLVGGVTTYMLWRFQSSQAGVTQTVKVNNIPEVKTVTALGRLDPGGEVIQVSAPTSSEGSRVEQLLVKEGDSVKAGQVIAILDSRARLQGALGEAQQQVRIAQAELASIKAGAKVGEIEAQRAQIARLEIERHNNIEAQTATVARLEAEFRNAQIENQRYQMLHQEGAISASLKDSKRLNFETAQEQLQEARANLKRIQSGQKQQLNEAKATLKQIAEVRPVDVEVAAAKVSSAKVAVQKAQTDLEQAYVKALQTGRVLKIHTYPSERVSDKGIIEFGKTGQMYAVAEVYQSDISKVHAGQRAKAISDSLPEQLQGTVERIGLSVVRQNVIHADPAANTDARVIEVWVRLDPASSKKVAQLTNLQVTVMIEI